MAIQKVQSVGFSPPVGTEYTTSGMFNFGVGHLVTLQFAGARGATITSISGGGVAEWKRAVIVTNEEAGEAKGEVSSEIWYGKVTEAGKNAVTVKFNKACTAFDPLVVSEWRGATGALDQTGGTTGTAIHLSSGSVLPASGNALVLATTRLYNQSVKEGSGPTNNWIGLSSAGHGGNRNAFHLMGKVPVAQETTWETFEPDHWASAIASFTAVSVPRVAPSRASGQVRFAKDFRSTFAAEGIEANAEIINHRFNTMLTYPPFMDGHEGKAGEENKTLWYKRGIAYRDTYAIYPNEVMRKGGPILLETHPNWILVDRYDHTRKLIIEEGEYCADITNKEWREFYITRLAEDFAAGTYIGVYMDDFNFPKLAGPAHAAQAYKGLPTYAGTNYNIESGDEAKPESVAKFETRTPYSLTKNEAITRTMWKEALATFVEEIRAAFPTKRIYMNMVWMGGEFEGTTPTDEFEERAIKAAAEGGGGFVDKERTLLESVVTGGTSSNYTVSGLFQYFEEIHILKAGAVLSASATTEKSMEYHLASYFLVNEGLDEISAGKQWIDAQPGWQLQKKGGEEKFAGFWPGFEVDLGHALETTQEVKEAYEENGKGLWTRRFENGIVYLLEPGGTETGVIQLPNGRWSNIQGEIITHIQLAPAEANEGEVQGPPCAAIALRLPELPKVESASPLSARPRASSICEDYSGIIIDQNIPSTAALDVGTSWFYQTFQLPSDYARGSTEGHVDDVKIPSLSGLQLLVSIPTGRATEASLNYVLEQYIAGSGWAPLTKGTVTGCHADGEKVWIDVFFASEVEITDAILNTDIASNLRIGFQMIDAIDKVWYVSPNPYAHGAAYQSDGVTPKENSSFNFRILALTADSGIDFLGNLYRSVAVHANAENAMGGNDNSGYWLSAPQPSKFAVVSHYSDVRPFPEKPTYGVINLVLNPSFEYDVVGASPAIWKTQPDFESDAPNEQVGVVKVKAGEWQQKLQAALNFDAWDSKATATVTTTEPVQGAKCLEVKTAAHNANVQHEPEGVFAPVTVALNVPITFSGWARCNGGGFRVTLRLGDSKVGLAETEFTVTSEWTRWSVTLTPRLTGTTMAGVVTSLPASHGGLTAMPARTFFLDGMMINKGNKAAPYIDGDSPSSQWENQRGRSVSFEITEPTIEDDAVVIDSVFIDPVTPGIAFNIYYTTDLTGSEEEGPMTEEQWEKKLWIHVPQSYITSTKQTYVLPEPITAKFVKVEFSHLQARPYDPGDYQKPIGYKLFPDWVATPFLAEVTVPEFIARRVGVVYDALELAYQPVLDDLLQSARSPERPGVSTVAGPAANLVDPDTLARINLVTNTYLNPPAFQGDIKTLLGQRASKRALEQASYPVEGAAEFFGNPSIGVSTLDRQAIVIDQSFPVMFFWVTARHEYKELRAKLDNNRAYFAGLNEIAFIRDTYTTTSDGSLYIESGVDDINTERNDFDIEENAWFTY